MRILSSLERMLCNITFRLGIQSKIWVAEYGSQSTDERQAKLMARNLPKRYSLPGVKEIVIIASGKGGVGKSTTSVNLAVTIAKMGKRVGLLDGDIFGPSIPLMMNLNDTPLVDKENRMIPLQNYGVKCLSMGFLIDPNKPVIWRGPLVMSALQRLLKGAVWEPLDVLIVDTPPGTGDIHLSLAQNVPISGILLVCTPQRAALNVTKRGAEMYEILKIPLIGLIENMSHVVCTNCHEKVKVYPNHMEQFAKDLNTSILGSLPIDYHLSECADSGIPIVITAPDSEHSKVYQRIAEQILNFLDNKK